jgi:hypothetical protein
MVPISRLLSVAVICLLAACGEGQPLFDVEGSDDGGDGIRTGPQLPPGTSDPTSRDRIVRFEAKNVNGGGFVTDVSYDPKNDTFSVDNLGFDGDNIYTRGKAVSSMNGYAVYEAEVEVEDPINGEPIDQVVPYRALLGISENAVGNDPRTSFAIVRTGGYVQYGFGGFIYERNGGVVLPTSGQARFEGDYAGVRVFNGQGGLEYTKGEMYIAIDFKDFNAGPAVQGSIYNREAFDSNGEPIDLGGPSGLVLPTLNFVIEGGATTIDRNGEMAGQLNSFTVGANGVRTQYESGTYYGVIAGDLTDPKDGGEIVGIVVIGSTDPRYNVPVQETGGFILYR